MSRDSRAVRCETCRHWHEVPRLDAEDAWTEGQCRRRPPAPALGHTIPGLPSPATLEHLRSARASVAAVWPLTEQDAWCGKWQVSRRAQRLMERGDGE